MARLLKTSGLANGNTIKDGGIGIAFIIVGLIPGKYLSSNSALFEIINFFVTGL